MTDNTVLTIYETSYRTITDEDINALVESMVPGRWYGRSELHSDVVRAKYPNIDPSSSRRVVNAMRPLLITSYNTTDAPIFRRNTDEGL